MKKIALFVIMILTICATLLGCTTPDVPGSAWAQKETLVYDVAYKTNNGEKGEVFGEATSVLQRIGNGTVVLAATGKEYKVSANTTHFSMETKDIHQNVIMKSEFIMDGFRPIASYKMVKFGNKDYFYHGEYGTKYVYTYQNNKTGELVTDGKISLSNIYMDNEFIYMYLRCYNFEKTLSKTFHLLNPTDGTSEAIAVKTDKTGEVSMKLPGSATEEKVAVTAVTITRTKVPVGSSIIAWYTNYDAATNKLNLGTKLMKDYHIPVRIDENDVVYVLQGENIEVVTAIA